MLVWWTIQGYSSRVIMCAIRRQFACPVLPNNRSALGTGVLLGLRVNPIK